ncbi:MAG: hypothetical protein ACYC4L_19550 [Chloroflexota bacterium]
MTEEVVPTTQGKVAPTPAAKRKVKPGTKPQLESQNDLAYLTGEHEPAEAEKQVVTPAPRRPRDKPKQ